MKIITIAILTIIIFLSSISYADCSLNLTLNKTVYHPADELIATAHTSVPGTIVFTLIDPLNQNKGTTAVTTITNNASVIFIVKEAWAKGNWTIQATLVTSSPSCQDSTIFYADTYTVPMDINISADYAMENLTNCYNMTSTDGVILQMCLNGKIPLGSSFTPGDITLPSFNFSETIVVGTEKYIRESEYNSLMKNCSRMPHTIQGLEGNNAICVRTTEKLTSNLTQCYEERDQCKNGIIENELQRKDYQIEQHKLNISIMEKDNNKFHFTEAIMGGIGGAFISVIITLGVIYLFITWKKKEDEE